MNTFVDKIWLWDMHVVCMEAVNYERFSGIVLKPDWFTLIVVVSGSINFVVDSSNVHLSAGEMYAVPTKAVVDDIKSPLCICLLSCSMDFVFIHKVAKFGIGYMLVLTSQSPFKLPLTEAEILHMIKLFGFLKEKLCNKPTSFQDEIIILWVNMILYEFGELCCKYGENSITVHGPREKLVMNFNLLVQQHCKVHHDVKFYADSLFVSSGHLGKTLRSITGMSVKHYISMAIIAEAYLLLADNNLSITDVSDCLNFNSSASFSSFFKKYTKFTPSQYRLI